MSQQNSQPITANGFVKTIQIIHGGLSIGILALLAIAFLSKDDLVFLTPNFTFLIIGITFLVGGIFIGGFLYKNRLQSITPAHSLKKKLSTFQTASIIRYAFIEGAAMFMGVQFLNSGNLYYAIIAFVALAIVMYLRPTKDKIAVDLNLTGEELTTFQKGDELL